MGSFGRSPPRAVEKQVCKEKALEKQAPSENRQRSSSRGAMPTNLNGLSLMLTGGGLKGQRSVNAPSNSREPREPKVHSGARAMPSNFDGLSLMLTGGALREIPQQKTADGVDPSGARRRR